MARAENDPSAGQGAATIGSLLDDATRRTVADLNRGFLRLCVDVRESSDPRFRLAVPVLERLQQLSEPALERAAACPFALFELRLARVIEAAVAGEGSRAAEPGVADDPAPSTDPRRQLFVQQALFFAWHLVRTSPLTGRLALGYPAAVEPLLRALSPSRFGDCSASEDVLRPRWPRHERFWFALLHAAELPSDALLRRTHCLGIQLLAAESNDHGEDPDSVRPPR